MLRQNIIKMKNQESLNTFFKVMLYVVPLTSLILIIGYVFASFYYDTHFYKETMINGVDVSNLSLEQTEEVINDKIKSYVLTLNGRNNMSEQILGSDINLHAEFNGGIAKLIEEQEGFHWIRSLIEKNDYELEAIIKYDEELLKGVFKKLNTTNRDNMNEPVNAYISEYGEQGYEIIFEDPGTKIKEDVLYEAIQVAIHTLEPNIDLEAIGSYEEAQIHSETPQLLDALYEMNKIASSEITYEFGEVTELLDGKTISEWIRIDDDFIITLDAEGVKNYVDYIGRTYNTFGKTRTFKTSYGDVIEIRGGDYGWWLNRGKEFEELTGMIMEGYKGIREPAYYQTAIQYGEDDIGDTYVEVNITAQHMFFYKEGKLIMETDFVSGNLARNYGTPTGTYPVQYKENNATLNGENYSTPVQYWMPFNGDIGFHDAPWRRTFGKDIYLKNGSHGCVNMPPSNAKILFEHIYRGMPVLVYELEGTENYIVKEEKQEKKQELKKEEKQKKKQEKKKKQNEETVKIED